LESGAVYFQLQEASSTPEQESFGQRAARCHAAYIRPCRANAMRYLTTIGIRQVALL